MPKSKYPIDLGRSMSSNDPLVSSGEAASEDKHYPTLYLEWEDDYELPEAGMMKVRFKKRSETNKKGKNGRPTMQMVELDVVTIESVSGEKSIKKDREESGEALDKLADKVVKKVVDESDDESEDSEQYDA